jgi:thiamine kinase-like enzyme
MVPLSTEERDGTEAGTSGERAAPQQGMTLIDFEYSDWAPRGFDWGNHFCE